MTPSTSSGRRLLSLALVSLLLVSVLGAPIAFGVGAGGDGTMAANGATPTPDPGGEPGTENNSKPVATQSAAPVDVESDFDRATDEVTVIVRYSNGTNLDRFVEQVEGISIEKRFWLIDAVAVSVNGSRSDVDAMSTVAGVDRIHSDFEVEAESVAAAPSTATATSTATADSSVEATYGLEQINATAVWTEFDTRGEGVSVAVLDSGVDVGHPDIDLYTEDPSDPTYPGGWAEFDSNGNVVDGSEPIDDYGHGTHVSGTVGGGNASGEHIGVAPGADLIHGRVLPGGQGTYSQIVGGMEWAVENDVDVITLSLGSDGYNYAYIEPIRNARAAGTVVVASVGNNDEGTSSSPGNEYDTIGVGASDSGENIRTFSGGEVVTTGDAWGSKAPDDWPDEYVAPTVAAPGSWVYSSVPGDDYQKVSGTSMAAPHVAGAIALVQSATDEHHTPAELEAAITETARKPDDWDESYAAGSLDGQDTRYGHGIVDAYAAVEYLRADSATFDVSAASLNESTVLEGDPVEVTATVENIGDAEGTYEAEFRLVDDAGTTTVLDRTTVTLAPNDSRTVSLVGTADDAGTYQADVGGEPAGTLVVERPAILELSDGSLSDGTITEGESVAVSAVAENVGDRSGTFSVELHVDGTETATTEVTVDGGETTTVSFSYEPAGAGEYDLSVAADDGDGERTRTSAGTLVVESPADLEVTSAGLSNDTIRAGDVAEVSATVTNHGDQTGELTARLAVDGTVRNSSTVTVEGASSTTVTFAETIAEPGEYAVAVNDADAGILTVEATASFTVTDAATNRSTMLEGEALEVTATVRNEGDRDGTYDATLELDGVAVATREVTVEGGEAETVTFVERVHDAGEYAVAVNGTEAGTLTVDAPAAVTVSDASLNETTVLEGDPVAVTATVENAGDREGTVTAELTVESADSSESLATRDVTVAGGGTETVTFTSSFASAGEYAVAVNDAEAGTLTVEQPATFAVEAGLDATRVETGEPVRVTATVENTGDRDGTFAAELRVDGETVATRDLTVAAADSTETTFERSFESAGEYDLAVTDAPAGTVTVTEPSPASFAVDDPWFQPDVIVAGDDVTAGATVENTGDETGTYTADLRLDGVVAETVEVTLAPAESANVTVSTPVDEPGEYEVAVGDAVAGTLVVDRPANLAVTAATLDPASIEAGESVTVTATVENTGDRGGQIGLALELDGESVDETTTTVPGDTRRNVTFERVVSDAGQYELSVNGVAAGTLEVGDADGGDGGDDGGNGGSDGGGDGDGGSDGGDDGGDGSDGGSDGGGDGDDGGTGGGTGVGGGGGGFGGGGGGAPPAPAEEPSEPEGSGESTVTVATTDEGASIEVSSLDESWTATADLEGRTAGPGMDLTNLELQLAPGTEDFRLELGRPTPETLQAPAPEQYDAVGYLRVEKVGVDNDDIERVRFAFSVPETALPEGSTSAYVVLLRYHDGEWQDLETNHEGGTAYSATAPGFSEFAVAVRSDAAVGDVGLDVLDFAVADDPPAPGEALTAIVDVENTGSATATRELALLVDGEVVTLEELSVRPGERLRARLTTTVDAAGTYEVALRDADVEPVTVSIVGAAEDPAGRPGGGDTGAAGGNGVAGVDAGPFSTLTTAVPLVPTSLVVLLVLLVASTTAATRYDAARAGTVSAGGFDAAVAGWFRRQSYLSLVLKVGTIATVCNVFVFALLAFGPAGAG